jgi:hypothetical protein
LPIWLIALPLPNRVIACLYAAIGHLGGFYPNQMYRRDDPAIPCFVHSLGDRLDDDRRYFFCGGDDYHWDALYLQVMETEMFMIGSRIDRLGYFIADIDDYSYAPKF